MNKHLKGNEKQSVQKRAGEEKFCNNKQTIESQQHEPYPTPNLNIFDIVS